MGSMNTNTATMPNFLVIGAAKSGTTALYQYLRRHPQVYMTPRKHPKFFAYENEEIAFRGPPPRLTGGKPWAITDVQDYLTLFEGVEDEVALGEVSHSYLYRPTAAERIHRYIPDAKLIVILRNPVDRAYSHFLNMVRGGREPLEDFAEALAQEEDRIRANWWPEFHYTRMGRYHKQLKRYFDLFGRDQISVYLYEEWDADTVAVLQDIFSFLGVDTSFKPELIRYKRSGIPKHRASYAFFMALESARPAVERMLPTAHATRLARVAIGLKDRTIYKPPLTPELRERLIDSQREDVLALQELIGRDLSGWLETKREPGE